MRSFINASVNVVINDRQDRVDVAGIAKLLRARLLGCLRFYAAAGGTTAKPGRSHHAGPKWSSHTVEHMSTVGHRPSWRPEHLSLLAFTQ